MGIEVVIAVLVGLVLGGIGVFMVKKIQDETTKKSAKAEADKIINKAKSESARVKRDSEAKAKDFEARSRKNVEQDIVKQKNQLKQKETSLERRMKDLEDEHARKLEENQRYQNQLKDREEKSKYF